MDSEEQQEAKRRFGNMSLTDLVDTWEERMFDYERTCLTEELDRRGYRMKSLPVQEGDFPSDDPAALERALAEVEAESVAETRSAGSESLKVGRGLCFMIAAMTLVLPASGLVDSQLNEPIEWTLAAVASVVFVVLGVAIGRGSRTAAIAAVVIWGAEIFGRMWFAADAGVGTGGPKSLGVGATAVLIFIWLVRCVIAIPAREHDVGAE